MSALIICEHVTDTNNYVVDTNTYTNIFQLFLSERFTNKKYFNCFYIPRV